MRMFFCCAAASLALASFAPAAAAITVYNGDTTGGPTYNRPVEDLSSLSAVGTAVRYDTRTFTVSQSGQYTFIGAATFDSELFLYSTAFDAANSLLNAVIGNDDLLSFTTSGFAADLVAGNSYTLVTTGFANSDFGAYSVNIGGQGTLSPLLSGPPSPAIFQSSGNTTGEPTFNRPIEDLSVLSAVGTATPYDVFGFTVSTSGQYNFTTTGEFDTFFSLYANAFDPGAPLANGIVADDDLLGFTTSGFSANLVAGVDYFGVISGFTNNDDGVYSLLANGAGRINAIGGPAGAVPEPSTWMMMILGFGGIGLALRRRSRALRLQLRIA